MSNPAGNGITENTKISIGMVIRISLLLGAISISYFTISNQVATLQGKVDSLIALNSLVYNNTNRIAQLETAVNDHGRRLEVVRTRLDELRRDKMDK